jgi:hypothetical protein
MPGALEADQLGDDLVGRACDLLRWQRESAMCRDTVRDLILPEHAQTQRESATVIDTVSTMQSMCSAIELLTRMVIFASLLPILPDFDPCRLPICWY